jgi:hypothetical protein
MRHIMHHVIDRPISFRSKARHLLVSQLLCFQSIPLSMLVFSDS